MKYLLYILIYLFSLPLRFFYRINNNLLLFSSRGGVAFEGNSKYLFLYAVRNTNYRCVWISKSKKIVNELNKLGYNSYYYFSFNAIYLSLSAKVIFITHSIFDATPVFFNSKTKIIDLWHGVPIKKIAFLDKNQKLKSRIMDFLKSLRLDFMISNSKTFSKIYSTSFRIQKEKIKNFGQSKIEFLHNPDLFIDKLVNPFPTKKKIILYAPTFRDYKFKNPLFLKKSLVWLNEELKKTNSLLYIKLHPSENNPNINSFHNIKIIDSKIDIYNLFPFVDKLISDYSSTFLDFLSGFPEREIALFVPDFELYKSRRDFNLDFNLWFSNFMVTDLKLLLKNFKYASKDLVNKINPKVKTCSKILELID